MEISLLILLLLIVFALFAQRKELKHPSYKTLLFLSIASLEEDKHTCPEKSIRIRKFLTLPAPPLPGMELDGQGTEQPLKITRSVLDEHQIIVHFEPIRVPLSEVESYVNKLGNCQWEILW